MLDYSCSGWFRGSDRYVVWYGGYTVDSEAIGRYKGLMDSFNTAFITKKSNHSFEIVGEITRIYFKCSHFYGKQDIRIILK